MRQISSKNNLVKKCLNDSIGLMGNSVFVVWNDEDTKKKYLVELPFKYWNNKLSVDDNNSNIFKVKNIEEIINE